MGKLFITKLYDILLNYSRKGLHLGDVVFKVNELMCENNLESEEILEACHCIAYQVYFKVIDCCHAKGNKQDSTEEAKEADNSIIDGDNISDQQKKAK